MEKLYDSNRNMEGCAQSYDTPVSRVLKSAMLTLTDNDWQDIEDIIRIEHVSILFFWLNNNNKRPLFQPQVYTGKRQEQRIGTLVNPDVFQPQADVVPELGAFEPELCANQIF